MNESRLDLQISNANMVVEGIQIQVAQTLVAAFLGSSNRRLGSMFIQSLG